MMQRSWGEGEKKEEKENFHVCRENKALFSGLGVRQLKMVKGIRSRYQL